MFLKILGVGAVAWLPPLVAVLQRIR